MSDHVFARDTRDFTDLDSTIPAPLSERMALATEEAGNAFWAEIVRHFPEVKSGDFGPGETHRMERDQAWAVWTWLYWNWPHRDPNPDTFDPLWEGPPQPEPPTDEQREEVIRELTVRGVAATHEYPGVVCIRLRNGLSVNTGMHGWDYGSWMGLHGDPIEDGRPGDYEQRHLTGMDAASFAVAGAAHIADLWRDVIADVEENWFRC